MSAGPSRIEKGGGTHKGPVRLLFSPEQIPWEEILPCQNKREQFLAVVAEKLLEYKVHNESLLYLATVMARRHV